MMSWGRVALKAILYRSFSVLVTYGITWLVTGSWTMAGMVAVLYGVAATINYVLFERVWDRVTRRQVRRSRP